MWNHFHFQCLESLPYNHFHIGSDSKLLQVIPNYCKRFLRFKQNTTQRITKNMAWTHKDLQIYPVGRIGCNSLGSRSVPVAKHDLTCGWNDDSECPCRARSAPGHGSRTQAARSSRSSSQPVAVGSAAGRPGWAQVRQG